MGINWAWWLHRLFVFIGVQLGIGVTVFSGTMAALGYLRDFANTSVSQLAAATGGLVGLMGLDIAVSMIVSAYSLKISYTMGRKFMLI